MHQFEKKQVWFRNVPSKNADNNGSGSKTLLLYIQSITHNSTKIFFLTPLNATYKYVFFYTGWLKGFAGSFSNPPPPLYTPTQPFGKCNFYYLSVLGAKLLDWRGFPSLTQPKTQPYRFFVFFLPNISRNNVNIPYSAKYKMCIN